MQTGAPADREGFSNSLIQNLNDSQYLTITYTSANSLCSVVWLGGVDRGVWSAAPAGCSVGCGRGVRHWGTIMVERDQALLGWGPRVACCVPASVGPRGHLQIGLCGPPLLPDCYLVLRNIMFTHWKQTPFF